MRQIKFRAWDKRTCKMFPVASVHFGDDGSALTITADLAPKEHAYSTIDKLIIHGESGVLMQFTGLQDRNGKEIYDGDIIEIMGLYGDKQTAQIFWGLSYDSYVWITGETWRLRIIKGDVPGAEGSLHPYCEPRHGFDVCVIGNIYEHPDLLAKEQ